MTVLALGASLLGTTIRAADQPPAGVGSREIWVGADAGAHNWLVYSGSTYAPWGDIHQDGFRVRATTGYGHYDYQWDAKTKVKIDKTYSDAMVGYQHRFGDLTAKAFAGWAMLKDLDVPSAKVRRERFQTGFKTALELWLNLGAQGWTSLDVSYADTRETASIRSRIGYRILPTVSAGSEAVFNHASLKGQVQIDTSSDQVIGNVRTGLFVRYEWFGGEISASGGVTGDIRESLDEIGFLNSPSAYGTLNLIVQF
ncbi:MAG: cellulose biosynthesis protein BcsS [Hyphomicrobiaceae bacterium]